MHDQVKQPLEILSDISIESASLYIFLQLNYSFALRNYPFDIAIRSSCIRLSPGGSLSASAKRTQMQMFPSRKGGRPPAVERFPSLIASRQLVPGGGGGPPRRRVLDGVPVEDGRRRAGRRQPSQAAATFPVETPARAASSPRHPASAGQRAWMRRGEGGRRQDGDALASRRSWPSGRAGPLAELARGGSRRPRLPPG